MKKLICRICKWTGTATDMVYKRVRISYASGVRMLPTCPVCGSTDVDDASINPYDRGDDGDLLN